MKAYVHWNAGICRVLEYPSQKLVAKSTSYIRATNKARRLGYSVKVYVGFGSEVLKPIPEIVVEYIDSGNRFS